MLRSVTLFFLLGLACSAVAQTPPVRRSSAPLFTIAFSNRIANWFPGMPGVEFRVGDSSVELRGAKSRYGYQLISIPVRVEPGVPYELDFDIQVTSGAMMLGVLTANEWVAKELIEARTGTLAVTSPSAIIQIIVGNNNSNDEQASSAVIFRLSLKRKK